MCAVHCCYNNVDASCGKIFQYHSNLCLLSIGVHKSFVESTFILLAAMLSNHHWLKATANYSWFIRTIGIIFCIMRAVGWCSSEMFRDEMTLAESCWHWHWNAIVLLSHSCTAIRINQPLIKMSQLDDEFSRVHIDYAISRYWSWSRRPCDNRGAQTSDDIAHESKSN